MSRIDLDLAKEPDAVYYLKDKLKEIKKEYDYILIDCPPSLALSTQMALAAADAVIIPLECQELSVKGTIRLIRTTTNLQEKVNRNLKILGYLISKYDGRRKLEENYRGVIRRTLKEKVFPVELKDNVQFTEAVSIKKPITIYLPHSEQANIYRQLAKELTNHG